MLQEWRETLVKFLFREDGGGQYTLPGMAARLSKKASDSADERSPASLANRILLLQIVWAILFGMLTIGTLWWGTTKVIEDSFQRQGEGWIKKLDELATPLYTSEEKNYFAETVDYLKNFPEISSVEYFDELGEQVIAEYHRSANTDGSYRFSEPELQLLRDTSSSVKPQLFGSSESSSVFHISAPIWVKSVKSDGMYNFSLDEPINEAVQIMGILRVGLDYSHYQKDLQANVLYGSALIILLLSLAALAGRVLVRWALRPLLQLEEPLNKLAQGETNVVVESGGDREIAKIGKVLNTTISALKERDETLRRIANHDALTDLLNRNYFTEKLESELQRIGREGGSSALLFIDLDRFKFINDTYGHVAGDRLLIEVANLLKHRMRDGDLISRFGGDEFVALVYKVNQRKAREIAESLLNLMREFHFHEAGETLQIFFSIGITVFDSGLQTSHDVFMQADAAVREAKKEGRNRYHLFDSKLDGAVVYKDQGWHSRISQMLQEQDLLLYYQPLKGLHSAEERICEVLPRMYGSAQELLLPSAFFPAAERYGLMSEVDKLVIRKAAQWLAGIEDKQLVLSVNLSQQTIEGEWLEESLPGIFAEYGLTGSHFIFEIAEAVLLRNSEKVHRIIRALKEYGCRFAVDDYGSGFASFNYLKQYQIDMLKINHLLIEKLAGDPVAQVSVNSIVEVAKLLNMQTVAKFVPDDLTLHTLNKMGVNYAQGNFFCEAMPTSSRKSPDFSLVR